jgi:hypothetical protein
MSRTISIDRLRSQVNELIETHRDARDIESFGRYRNAPIKFVRDVLKAEPYDQQRKILHLVQDEPRTLVMSANSMGKDWLTAHLALWWVYARRGLVILTGRSRAPCTSR